MYTPHANAISASPRVGSDNQTSAAKTALKWSPNVERGPEHYFSAVVQYKTAELSKTFRDFELKSPETTGASTPNFERVIKKYVPVTPVIAPFELGIIVQDWEGVVSEISKDTFTARLLDRTRQMKVDTETAEIPLAEVDAGDRSLVTIGSIFYLTIRRRIMQNGRQEVASALVFRRLPAWHASTLARVKQQAADLAAYFEPGI